jgi:IclR family transcriptional regulator, KDG regulon repressor
MMHLLEVLALHAEAVNLKTLATSTSLHPSTAHRILNVMVASRMVERSEPGMYRLGIRLLEFGNLVKSRINVRQEALPHMQVLQKKLGETVNLSVRDGDYVVYVERAAPGGSLMRVVQALGARVPMHVTSVGKIFLGEAGRDTCLDYAKRTGLTAHTPATITDTAAFAREIETVRHQGYAFDREEAERGVSCIGAGIYNDDGKIVAGLSVSAPSDRLKSEWANDISETALRISRAMGFRRA